MNQTELTTLNDRLADVLIMAEGVKYGTKINPNGNKEQRESMISFCDYILNNLKKSKSIVQSNLTQINP